jgi:hypothetical protein
VRKKACALFRLHTLKLHGAAYQVVADLIWFGPQRSSREIAETTGIERRNVQLALDRLNREGLIRSLSGRGPQPATHELLFLEATGVETTPATGVETTPATGVETTPPIYKERARANTYLPNTEKAQSKSVSKSAPEAPEVAQIREALRATFGFPVAPTSPVPAGIWGIARAEGLSVASVVDWFRFKREQKARIHYRIWSAGSLLEWAKRDLPAWEHGVPRKPVASSSERQPLESGPPLTVPQQIETWEMVLAADPNHQQALAELARLRPPRAMATGAGG